MGRFRTALGEEFVLERRLPTLYWRPRMRRKRDGEGLLDFADLTGDDLGVIAIFGLLLLAVALVLLLFPLLLLVLEVALVVALVIPLMVLAVVLGIKQHTVVLRRAGGNGEIVDQRQAHGVLGTWRQGRALKAAASSGAYRR